MMKNKMDMLLHRNYLCKGLKDTFPLQSQELGIMLIYKWLHIGMSFRGLLLSAKKIPFPTFAGQQ